MAAVPAAGALGATAMTFGFGYRFWPGEHRAPRREGFGIDASW